MLLLAACALASPPRDLRASTALLEADIDAIEATVVADFEREKMDPADWKAAVVAWKSGVCDDATGAWETVGGGGDGTDGADEEKAEDKAEDDVGDAGTAVAPTTRHRCCSELTYTSTADDADYRASCSSACFSAGKDVQTCCVDYDDNGAPNPPGTGGGVPHHLCLQAAVEAVLDRVKRLTFERNNAGNWGIPAAAFDTLAEEQRRLVFDRPTQGVAALAEKVYAVNDLYTGTSDGDCSNLGDAHTAYDTDPADLDTEQTLFSALQNFGLGSIKTFLFSEGKVNKKGVTVGRGLQPKDGYPPTDNPKPKKTGNYGDDKYCGTNSAGTRCGINFASNDANCEMCKDQQWFQAAVQLIDQCEASFGDRLNNLNTEVSRAAGGEPSTTTVRQFPGEVDFAQVRTLAENTGNGWTLVGPLNPDVQHLAIQQIYLLYNSADGGTSDTHLTFGKGPTVTKKTHGGKARFIVTKEGDCGINYDTDGSPKPTSTSDDQNRPTQGVRSNAHITHRVPVRTITVDGNSYGSCDMRAYLKDDDVKDLDDTDLLPNGLTEKQNAAQAKALLGTNCFLCGHIHLNGPHRATADDIAEKVNHICSSEREDNHGTAVDCSQGNCETRVMDIWTQLVGDERIVQTTQLLADDNMCNMGFTGALFDHEN